jgi:hypothetical protein
MERMSNLALEIAERCVANFSNASEIDAIEALRALMRTKEHVTLAVDAGTLRHKPRLRSLPIALS